MAVVTRGEQQRKLTYEHPNFRARHNNFVLNYSLREGSTSRSSGLSTRSATW